MYIGEIIKNYRKENKLSQRAFASRTSLSPSYINTLEKIYNPKNGKPYSVTTDAAVEIANAMFINIEELLNMLDKSQEFEISSAKTDRFGNSIVSIPLLGEVRAGYDYLAQENWLGTVDIKEELAKTGEFFALKVKGDSMFETLWDNDIVAVRRQDFAENNQIVVAIINGDEATVKMYKTIPNGIMLQPLNRKYDDLIFTEKQIKETPVKIIGVVKQIIERNFN